MGKKRTRRRFRLLSVFTALAVVLAATAYGAEFFKLRELQDKRAYYTAVYENLQAKHDELTTTLSLLNDETYMERLARERFKLIKPNEYLVLPAETNEDIDEYVGVDKSNIH